MLIKSEKLELNYAQSEVKEFLVNSIILTVKHKEYLEQFVKGNYKPELLFSGETLENIKMHPMALWKTMNIGKKQEPQVIVLCCHIIGIFSKSIRGLYRILFCFRRSSQFLYQFVLFVNIQYCSHKYWPICFIIHYYIYKRLV